MFELKKGLASLAIAGSLFGASALATAAAPPPTVQQGGAAGLVAAVVQAANLVNNDGNIEVVTVKNTLNNLTALNNVLNNSPILSNNAILNDAVITVIDGDVEVLNNSLNEAQLNVLTINVQDIVAVIEVIDGGDFIVITR